MSHQFKKWFLIILAVMLPVCGWAYGLKPVPNPQEVLQIADVRVTAVPTDKLASVAVLGTLKNTGAQDIEELVLEVKFTNAQGAVIDVLSEHQTELSIPAHGEMAFRVRGDGAALAAAYAGAQVRVVSAKLAYDSTERQGPFAWMASLWMGLLSFGPILILILVWVLLLRKYNGKNSVGERTLNQVKDHQQQIMPLIERQTVALEKMAEKVDQA